MFEKFVYIWPPEPPRRVIDIDFEEVTDADGEENDTPGDEVCTIHQ